MNPLEYFDALKKVEINKIQKDSKTEYTKDEVMSLIKEMNSKYKKAIFKGEYIFNIETLDKQNITVDDTEYAIQKLVTHDNKYLLFIQITDILDKDFGETDIQIMAEEISKAASKSNNIAGVIILPPNMEISLITAKLEASFKVLDAEIEMLKEMALGHDTFAYVDNYTSVSDSMNIYSTNTLNTSSSSYKWATTNGTSVLKYYFK